MLIQSRQTSWNMKQKKQKLSNGNPSLAISGSMELRNVEETWPQCVTGDNDLMPRLCFLPRWIPNTFPRFLRGGKQAVGHYYKLITAGISNSIGWQLTSITTPERFTKLNARALLITSCSHLLRNSVETKRSISAIHVYMRLKLLCRIKEN